MSPRPSVAPAHFAARNQCPPVVILSRTRLTAPARGGRVLGVHAALDGAGEIMLAATYAIKANMTVDAVAGTWAPYLTMAESLRLAAGMFRGHLPTSCCA